MCGIAGIFGQLNGPADQRERSVHAMTDVLARRGPDAQGHYFDHHAGVAFGHRRLSVVDLSDAGADLINTFTGVNRELKQLEEARFTTLERTTKVLRDQKAVLDEIGLAIASAASLLVFA